MHRTYSIRELQTFHCPVLSTCACVTMHMGFNPEVPCVSGYCYPEFYKQLVFHRSGFRSFWFVAMQTLHFRSYCYGLYHEVLLFFLCSLVYVSVAFFDILSMVFVWIISELVIPAFAGCNSSFCFIRFVIRQPSSSPSSPYLVLFSLYGGYCHYVFVHMALIGMYSILQEQTCIGIAAAILFMF